MLEQSSSWDIFLGQAVILTHREHKATKLRTISTLADRQGTENLRTFRSESVKSEECPYNKCQTYDNQLLPLVIRKAKSSDADAFLALVRALAKFEKLDPPTPSAARRLIRDTFSKKNKRLNLTLAFSDGRPVAYALYFFTYSSFLARPTLYLEDIFVLEDLRRKKIGRKMFLNLVKEAKKLGCGRMEWSVLSWNKNAIRFYEHIGAKRLDQWHYYRLDQRAIESLIRQDRGNNL